MFIEPLKQLFLEMSAASHNTHNLLEVTVLLLRLNLNKQKKRLLNACWRLAGLLQTDGTCCPAGSCFDSPQSGLSSFIMTSQLSVLRKPVSGEWEQYVY